MQSEDQIYFLINHKLTRGLCFIETTKPVVDTVDKRKHNHGRPRKISPRDKHLILRQISILREQYGFYTMTNEINENDKNVVICLVLMSPF